MVNKVLSQGYIFHTLFIVSLEDHSNNDCLLVVVMTHGYNGILEARDREYEEHELMESLTDDRDNTLRGKPKLFFLQACRGYEDFLKYSQNHMYKPKQTLTDNNADVLVMHSTQPEYVSHRDSNNGTWFIQALCCEINDFRFTCCEKNLLKLLSRVIKRVSEMMVLNEDGETVTQIPSLTTSFTKKFMLKVKNL